MDKTETLPPTTNTRSTLQELFARTRATMEPPIAPHRRRPEAESPVMDVVEPRTVSAEPPAQPIRRTPPSNVVLEPVSHQPYDISYAFVLIPRFTAHYLIGDIAESLRDWMHQLCIGYSWHLDYVCIRPEYMQWVVTVPAAVSPSGCIHKTREFTSRRVFADFPHIREENISEDFWAPGYSVLLGRTPHPMEMVNEYIHLTRQQQGIQPRLRD